MSSQYRYYSAAAVVPRPIRLRIAVEADVDPRSVDAYIVHAPLRPRASNRIAEAMARLGIERPAPPPVEVSAR